MFRRAKRDERGATLVLVALSLVASLSVVGVVVDGGSAYAERRQMQNAADAAALSGTRAFDRMAVGQESAVWTAVVASAVSNGATSGTVVCRLVDDVLVDVGACPTVNTGGAVALKAAAAGVRVTVSSTKATSFIRVAGITTFTAGARATAQLEGLRSGDSPFALCATSNTDPRSLNDGQTIGIINPDNSMNPNAIGQTYFLQDPSHSIGCGQGAQFKGLSADSTISYPTPGPWTLQNGDHGINVFKAVVAGNSACGTDFAMGCIVAVPLCHANNPPVSLEFYCERFGAFQINTPANSATISGVLLSAGVVATGGQGGGKPLAGEARVLKLSE